MAMGLGMQHWEHGPLIVCSHDDPGLNLTYFMARSNLVPYAFVWEKVKMDFSETMIDFVMNIASMGHNDKRYLLTSKFCLPEGLFTLNTGLS